MLEPLQPPDTHHLNAVQGWLELGNWLEANEELEKITPQLRAHPDVLLLKCRTHSLAGRWDAVFDIANTILQQDPTQVNGWIERSNALHFLGRYQEAFDCLRPGLEKFPDQPMLPYNLACFCSRLGRLQEAEQWLQRTFAMKGSEPLKLQALEDPDLEPLRKKIGNL